MTDTDAQMIDRPSVRYRLYEILEIGAVYDRASKITDGFLIGLILANVLAVVLGSVPDIADRYSQALYWFEVASVIVFAIEYLVRLWICVERSHIPVRGALKSRLRYIISPMALVDLAAIAPFFLSLIGVDLRVLRIIRLIRLFKLVRYSPALVTLGRVIKNEQRALVAVMVVIMGLIVISGSIIFYLEHEAQPDTFGHIPQSMWWAIATLTTVGYGDVVPITDMGRFFGGLVMVFGLGMYALPIAIIASGFANEVGQRDFVITWHALVKVPLFSHLDAASIADIVDMLKARIVMPGQIIARIGDPADDMFFVLSGDVQVQTRNRNFRIGPGDHFGEIALLTGAQRFGSARAVTRCQLMTLSRADFHHLVLDNAQIRDAILDAIRNRLESGSGIGQEISAEEAEEVRRSLDQLTAAGP